MKWLWRVEWSRDRWCHVNLKGQTHDPNKLRAHYLENNWRCYLTTIALCYSICWLYVDHACLYKVFVPSLNVAVLWMFEHLRCYWSPRKNWSYRTAGTTRWSGQQSGQWRERREVGLRRTRRYVGPRHDINRAWRLSSWNKLVIVHLSSVPHSVVCIASDSVYTDSLRSLDSPIRCGVLNKYC